MRGGQEQQKSEQAVRSMANSRGVLIGFDHPARQADMSTANTSPRLGLFICVLRVSECNPARPPTTPKVPAM